MNVVLECRVNFGLKFAANAYTTTHNLLECLDLFVLFKASLFADAD